MIGNNLKLNSTNSVDDNQVNLINVYRMISVIVVFFLHTFIFSSRLGFVYTNETWFLKTPAWAGVWLFYLLSGFLIGKGFLTGRYKENGKYTLKSVFSFWHGRILKVALPTWMFCFFSIILLDPGFFLNNKAVVIQLLTFRYFNNPASTIIGATWYVSSLMWLYFCAPFFAMVLDSVVLKLKKHRNIWIFLLFVLVCLVGMMLRLYLYKKGLDWSSCVYVPFYCNIDLYLCGMLINCFEKKKLYQSNIHTKCVHAFAVIMLLILVLVNSYVYYLSAINGKALFMYQYIFPTVYIIVGGLYIFLCGDQPVRTKGVSIKKIISNPLRLIDLFADISFEFYLVHSMVLNSIYAFFDKTNPLQSHIKLLVVGFLISTILAFCMHRVFVKTGK